MTHVVHVLSSFGMGGQERVAFDLAVSQVRAGWRVSAVSLAPPPDGPLAEELRGVGVEIARVARVRNGLDPILVLRLARWVRGHRTDLVHTHNRMALIYGAPAGRLGGARVVHTKHGKNPTAGKRLVLARVAARALDAFVAVSEETAVVARERHEIDVRRLSVISNGIELGRFHPDADARARIRRELGVPDDAWLVGTIGRVAIEKNQALLVEAMAPLLGPKLRLVIGGDGPVMADLRAAVDRAGAGPYTHLLGARRDVPAVLNALDTFALSSSTEGLPLVILEAMATALPIVSTNVGGIHNVLVEGQTGFLVPSGDALGLRARIAALAADRQASRTIGARGREVAVTKFSAERMQREYLDLYARVLSNKP